MNTKLIVYATASTLVVIGVVGFIDAVIDDRAGPAVLFALMTIGVAGMARTKVTHPVVAIRPDLASWLENTAPVTGETVEEMANRAISRLRGGFSPVEPASEDAR